MARLSFLFAGLVALAGCGGDPKPVAHPEGELPPLPPASGTPIGYLIDNASQLKLRDDQITKLKEIDNSLSARNDGIDTQLREIEKPEVIPEDPKAPPQRQNMAPGAQPMTTTADAGKLHEARKANNKDALERAFALLDPDQRVTAKKLLDERGVSTPGGSAPPPASDSGVPLEP